MSVEKQNNSNVKQSNFRNAKCEHLLYFFSLRNDVSKLNTRLFIPSYPERIFISSCGISHFPNIFFNNTKNYQAIVTTLITI